MNKHQRMVSIFWFFIGIYFAIAAYRLGLGHLHKPGPGFIFFIAGLLLTVLSIIDLIGNFIRKLHIQEVSIWKGFRWHKVLLVLGGLVACVYLFNILGFLVCTFLLMIFLFKAVEPTKWWVTIASSLTTTLISYAIFKVWLKVPFPVGILEF